MDLSQNYKGLKQWHYLVPQKSINKTKKGENVKAFEVILVQCYLVDNQHQQNSKVLYTFIPNKSYAYLLNIEPSNSVFLKSCNTQFDEIIITFTDQNSKLMEIKNKVNLILFIKKMKWNDILQNQEQEKLLKDIDFYHLQKDMKSNYWKKEYMRKNFLLKRQFIKVSL